MAADLVVLSRNIFDDPPEALLETEIAATVLGGEVVF
jgi:predicted amidohydrolase YtcJ